MNELDFYAAPGPMTDLGPHAGSFAGVGSAVTDVVHTVQGLFLHTAWASRYGVETDGRGDELQTRGAVEMLHAVRSLDGRPLIEARPPERRLQINCRHFSTLACALLRSAGVPSRARCGFGGYFEAGKWVDHWVIEHWDGDRWILSDAQIDDLQRGSLSIDFDPLDVPRDRFLVAGEAWRRCRAGEEDGDRFGIFDMWGQWFTEGNVPRDLASLNKVELLPWDAWGVMISGGTQERSVREALIDRAAEVTRSAEFGVVRSLYADERLRVPAVITSFRQNGDVEVRVL